MDCKNRIESLLLDERSKCLNSINSLLGNHLRNIMEAEEVLDEALVYALQRTELWQSRSRKELMGFLLWKSKCIIIDKARAMKVEAKAIAEKESALAENERGKNGTEFSPTFVLHRQAKRTAMERYINMLRNEDQKSALRMVRIEGRSLADAARVMGKSPGAVEKLVERGFESLMRTIRGAGGWKFNTTGETT